jgi:hypothetical protein
MKLLLSSLILLFATSAHAQVIYNGTDEQRATGIYKSVWVMKTFPDSPVEITLEKPTEDKDIKITTCVETENGCEPSRYFITTITESES